MFQPLSGLTVPLPERMPELHDAGHELANQLSGHTSFGHAVCTPVMGADPKQVPENACV